MNYNPQYPSYMDLKKGAKRRIPKFAFDFLEGTCSDENNLFENTRDLQKVKLKQNFIRGAVRDPDMKSSLCGIKYDMPIGMAPVGFQGIIWPNMSKILAQTASQYNIPFVLSTFSSNSIEEIATASNGSALFQLYNPHDESIRKDILKRASDCDYKALIVTVDIASESYRPRELRNGLIPPRFNFRNVWEVASHPSWALNMLAYEGIPTFKILEKYAKENNTTMTELRKTKMRGSVSFEDLKSIRNLWRGKLIIKGVLCDADVESAIKLGADGVIVSNHGGRQLDNGQTAISVLADLSKKYGSKIHISFDSGIESGNDIASSIASGAKFTFCGRAFGYGVASMGKNGGGHTVEMLQKQLRQVMCQIGCDDIKKLPKFLLK